MFRSVAHTLCSHRHRPTRPYRARFKASGMGTGRKGPKFKLGNSAGRRARRAQEKEDAKAAKKFHEARMKLSSYIP